MPAPPRDVRQPFPAVDPLHREGSPARRASRILVDVHRALWQWPVECLDNPSLLCYGSVNNLFVIYS